jgi:hypothetical protein
LANTIEADQQAAEERRKYQKMWSKPQYRINSPGLNVAEKAMEVMGACAGETITDFGCGEGKAMDWFRSQGMIASGVDIVQLRPDVIEACLWDMPKELGPSDFAICADVMEHIPQEHVRMVLAGIAARTHKAAFFQIANSECTVGKRHGETLHLTRETPEWWANEIGRYFRTVVTMDGDQEWRFIVVAWC